MPRYATPYDHWIDRPMPTTNPRIYVTLNKRTFRTIAELAHLQRRSHSAVVRELLEETEPVLARVAKLMRLASRNKGYAKALARDLERAQSEIELAGLEGWEALDRASKALDRCGNPRSRTGSQVSDRRTETAEPDDPGTTNRGVATSDD